MRERGLQIALMCLGVAAAAYAGGCGSDTASNTTSTSATSTSGEMSTTTSGGMTTSGQTTSAGSGSSSSGGTSGDNLGIGCTADGDCGPGLTCLTADGKIAPTNGNKTGIAVGGPANGYCSKGCATDADCPGNSSLCFGAAGGQMGVCLLTCDIGPTLKSLDEALDEGKCHGREDARCASVSSTLTACLPTCGRDDQCPAGRVCDPRLAVCVDKASTGLPAGAKCDQMAQTPECAGLCVSFGGDITMCSSPCGLGGDFTDLTAVADCGGIDKGVCAYSPKGNGAGDFGFCAPACKVHDECQNPTFWCNDVNLPDSGFCFGSDPCPNGQSDCKSPDKCTDTKYGPICLDPKYPLGSAAPAGTGSSGASSGSGSSGSGAGGSSSASSGSGAGGASASASSAVASVASAASSGTGP